MTDSRDDEAATPAGSRVRRSAAIWGAVAVLALVAAVITFAVAGPPYGANIAGGLLYGIGLLAGLVAAVLLWMSWAEVHDRAVPRRLRWGVGTAIAALALVSASAVVSLSHVASGAAQLWLIGGTAAVLALAV